MSEHTLKSIKRDSIRRVYDCISSKDGITRLEISKNTGLSLMTVGKIADALLDLEIILLEKSSSAKIGRRSECIKLNKSCAVIVLDGNKLLIVNLALEPVKELEFNDTDTAMKLLIDNSLEFKYIGMGATLKTAPELCDGIKALFGFADITVLDETYAKAVNGIMSLKAQNKSGLYIYSGGSNTCGTYFDTDTTVDDIRLGELHGSNAEELIFSIIAVSKFLNTNEIYLHSANSNTLKAYEVISVHEHDLHLGIARAVIDRVINITKRL